MANVLLLRNPSQDAPDRYEASFKSSGYNSFSVPVLETVFTNVDDLKRIMLEGAVSQNYEGVVITSARACEAWKHVVEDLVESSVGYVDSGVDWSFISFYAVGKATASVLSEIRNVYGHSPLVPKRIRGESCGTSEKLAHFILEDFGKKPAKLLYLTGDKNRDTLPKILKDGNIELATLKVYETQGSSSFAKDLEDAFKPAAQEFERWWIVFFAPSAAEFVMPIIRKFFTLHPLATSLSVSESAVVFPKIAAIGPTTLAFLHDTLGLRVDVVAPKPTPEDLVGAIITHDNSNSPS